MKILLVCDQFFSANNGMTISARRFASVLKDLGHEVRVLGYGDPEDESTKTAFLLTKQYIPVFDSLVSSQGMTFAKPDAKIIEEAEMWADCIHFLTPFMLTHAAVLTAQRLGKPYTAAFHVQPENISSSIHLGKCKPANDLIYLWFRHYVYKYCPYVHCPSNFIAGELKKHGYKSRIYVISNGIDPDFVYRREEKPAELKDKLVILTIGRYSIEKRHDVLIDAVKKSKYADKTVIIMAGKGPRAAALAKRAASLPNKAIMKFYTKEELLSVIASSDLYVHAADAEIEAMSCMEAFAGGLVPVIANSKKSATPQFALSENSLFKAGDPAALAEKIDYWFDHPEERAAEGRRYAELGKKYNLRRCVEEAQQMFNDAVNAEQEREASSGASGK